MSRCDLTPIGVPAAVVSGAVPGTWLPDLFQGTEPGNFGWLSWGGSPSEPALVQSLRNPAESATYVNPEDPRDRQLSAGDWVRGRPGVSNSRGVREALESLRHQRLIVPVWDDTRGHGDTAAYHIQAFAQVELIDFRLPQQNRISARFWGFVDCPELNLAPVVNAGPDQTNTAPATVFLIGEVADDGLPEEGALTAGWSVVTGPAEVEFENPDAARTFATFLLPGTYVLRLSASDSELGGSDEVLMVLNSLNRPPEPSPMTLETEEDMPVAVTLDATDPDGDGLEFVVLEEPAYGRLEGAPPALRYFPPQDYHGTNTFISSVSDGLYTVAVTNRIIVRPVNDPPVADAQTMQVPEDESSWIDLSGSDVEGDRLVFQIVAPPAHGALGLTEISHRVLYRPATNFHGTDEFGFAVSDGFLISAVQRIRLSITNVNDAPLVNAGADVSINLPENTVTLSGSVQDDEFSEYLEVFWSQLAGPAPGQMAVSNSPSTAVTFGASGIYVFSLTADDGLFIGRDQVKVTVNAAPVVHAGREFTNTLPAIAILAGAVDDDELPEEEALTVRWRKVSGPGSVVFENPALTNTAVSFGTSGWYGLELVADDGWSSSTGRVQVLANRAPFVSAGLDQTNRQDEVMALMATVSDDGFPSEGAVSVRWEASGPGTVQFADASATNTTATFSLPGQYLLSLAASDTLVTNRDEKWVVVLEANRAPSIVTVPSQWVFLPEKAVLVAEIHDDGIPETGQLHLAWQWVSGPAQPEFSDPFALRTEVSFSVAGNYVLEVRADDGLATNSVRVTVAVRELAANRAPLVGAGPDRVLGLTDQASLSGSVLDDGLPRGASLQVQWALVSGPGAVTFSDGTLTNGLVSFAEPGTYVLRLEASDSQLAASDDVIWTVYSRNHPPRVNAGPDQVVLVPDPTLFATNVTAPTVVVEGIELSRGLGAVARWNNRIGQPGFTGFPKGAGSVRGAVNGLSVSGTNLFAAGLFTHAGGMLAKGIARWNGAEWLPLYDSRPDSLTNLAAAPIGFISDLFETTGPLVARGDELFASGANLDNLPDSDDPALDSTARWDGVAWRAWNFLSASNSLGDVLDLAATSNAVYVAGWFSLQPEPLPGQPMPPPSHRIAKWDGSRWSGLGPSGITDIRGLSFAAARAVAVGHRGEVFVAGEFIMPTSTGLASNIVQWTGTDWAPLGLGISGCSKASCKAVVQAMTVAADGSLWVVGDFGFAGGVPANDVARWDGVGWTALGTDTGNGVAGEALAVAVRGNEVFVGGAFGNAGGFDARNLARWNGRFWSPLGSGSTNGTTGAVMALAADETGIYVSGDFETAGGMPAGEIAKWEFPPAPLVGAALVGSAVDDGLPAGAELLFRWTKLEGPGDVLFADPTAAHTTARFSAAGEYVLRLTASDSELESFDDLRINVQANRAPEVEATPVSATIGVNESLPLQGVVTDDGLPGNASVVQAWSAVSAPAGGVATFQNPSSPVTSVRFDRVGLYLVRLTANDSHFSSFVELPITVRSANTPPAANLAAYSSSVILPDSGFVRASVTDTAGLPRGVTNILWMAVSGPAAVAFADATAVETRVYFTVPGTYRMRLLASDTELTSSIDFQITVTGPAQPAIPGNLAPAVNAGVDRTVFARRPFNLEGLVTDDGFPAGRGLTTAWNASNAVDRVYFTDTRRPATTAIINAPGVYVMRLAASDGQYVSQDEVVVTVLAPTNEPPAVDAGADLQVTRPAPAQLFGVALDDGLPLGAPLISTWSAMSGPGAVVFNPSGSTNSAAPSTSATFSAPGVYALRLTVNDGASTRFDDVSLMVEEGTNAPPEVDAGPDLGAILSEVAVLTGQARDDGLPNGRLQVNWSQVSGPGFVRFSTLDNAWRAMFTAAGEYVLRFSASDGERTSEDAVTVNVYDAPEAPQVTLNSPIDGAVLTAPTGITGTVTSPILKSWSLRYRFKPANVESEAEPIDAGAGWRTLATGNLEVNNGPLGEFDPTLLQNGIYELVLAATDRIGRTSLTEAVTVIVDRRLKLGHFTVSFNDLTIPVAGIPLQVTRTYDSRQRGSGDFGQGWALDLRNIRLQKNRQLGLGWDQTSTGGTLPSYCLHTSRPRLVTITFPDGKVHKFRAVPVNINTGRECQALVPLEYPTMLFDPVGGDTRGTLVPLYEEGELIPDDQLVFGAFAGIPGRGDLISFERLLNPPPGAADNLLFDPDLFEFTSAEGFRYVLSETNGLRSVMDPNGNTLTVTRDGITWTNAWTGGVGVTVQFQRDDAGRITNIVDVLGQSMRYLYDERGDLQAFVDRDGHTNTFTYDGEHRLLTLSDGRGVTVLANDYDSSGRLMGNADPSGNRVGYAYDLPGQRTFVTNRLGFVTVTEFDSRGNVVRKIDPLGAAKTFSYDENDNLLSTTQAGDCACGKSYTYDAQDNRITETDARGHVTMFVYNDQRKVLARIEPSGFATTNSYDVRNNLLMTRDSAGQVARFEYNSLGKVTRLIDPLGHESRFGYDALGRLTNEVNALGHETAYELDANGNRLSQTITWSHVSAIGLAQAHGRRTGWMEASTAGSVSTSAQTNQLRLVMRHEYSPSGRPIRTLYYDGTTTETSYTEAGKKECEQDQAGLVTCYQYTALGQIEEVTHPSGCRERFQYDAEGQLVVSTDKRGFETRYTYDPNGRMVRAQFADQSEIRATYYADGSLHTETARNGEVTRYGLDADGNRVSVSNSVGVTRFEYNYKNFATAKVDPLGRTNRYEYDLLGRNTAVHYPDGSAKRAEFSGKLVTCEIDPEGGKTFYGYDPLGRLTSVTNAAGEVRSFTYDEQGNKTAEMDPLGHATFFEYDSMRHLVRVVHPDRTTQTTAYDVKGRALSRTDQEGNVTRYAYDRADNVVAITNALGGVTAFAYDCGGNKVYQQDPDGKETHFEYDSQSRLTRVLLPCGAEETTGYDLAGRAVSRTDASGQTTRFDYDLRDNLVQVTEPGERVQRFNYDAAGNRIAETDPARQTTTFDYDALDRRVRTVWPDQSVDRVEYDRAGRVTRRIDPDGKVSTIHYDAVGRRFHEIDPLGHGVSHAYDAAGRTIAATNANGFVTRFQYDAMGRQTVTVRPDGASTVFAYDSVGRLASKTDAAGNTTFFAYDELGRLRARQDPQGNTVRWAHDAVGRVTSQTDALGNLRRFEHDCRGRPTTTIQPDGSRVVTQLDALGRVVSRFDGNTNGSWFGYDLFGNLTSTTNALGQVTSFGYDSLNRLTTRIDALGRVTRFEYDALGRRVGTIHPDGAVESTAFDAKGRTVRATNPAGHSTFFAYDDGDRLVGVTNALGQVTRFEYDAAGRLLARIDALGRTTAFEYDELDRRTRTIFADQTFHQTRYGALGQRTSETDAAGRTTHFGHDDLGRLIAVTNALGGQTFYEYDALGRLTAETNANAAVTRYAYDSVGRRVRRTLPGGPVEALGYDHAGNLIAWTNFNGRVVRYEYDALNRLIAKIPDAELQATGSVPVHYEYNAVGSRIGMTDGSGSTEYTYDIRDRLQSKTLRWAHFAVPPTVVSYRHDTNGNLAGIQSSNPNGAHVSYAHDELDRLGAAWEEGVGGTGYGYDAGGNLRTTTRANGLSEISLYDLRDRRTNSVVTRGGQRVAEHLTTFGAAGHRESVTDVLSVDSGERTVHRTFAYDETWRLQAEIVQAGQAPPVALEYRYDAVGNRTRLNSTWPAIPAASQEFTVNDWLLGDSYDANGNTLGALLRAPLTGVSHAVTDQFDFEDRLVFRSTTTASGPATIRLHYDGDGNRVARSVTTGTNTLTTLFVVEERNPTGYAQVLEELTSVDGGSFGVTRVYSWGHGLLSQDQFDGTQWKVSFPGFDSAGNIRLLTDGAGEITDTFDYDAFGNLVARTGATPCEHLFRGQLFDWDLNLYYLRARYHNPATGRFWTADRFEGFPDDPASRHRYAFNQNDPVNRIDPSGHLSLSETLQVSGLAPMVRSTLLGLWEGVNNHAYGMAGGNALKFSNREEAYFIDSLAVGPGWKFGKPNFWAAAQGAPFLLSWNPNIWQSARPCGYRCIPFDLDIPVYGPEAAHPIFELQPSELYQYLEAPVEFVRGVSGNLAESVTGLVRLGADVLGSAGYGATLALTHDLEAAELLFGPQLRELNEMVGGAHRLGVDAAGAAVYWNLRPYAPAVAAEFFGDYSEAFRNDLQQLWWASTGGADEGIAYRTGYTIANFSPLLLGKLGKVRALGAVESLHGFREATAALKSAVRAQRSADAPVALLTEGERVCRVRGPRIGHLGIELIDHQPQTWRPLPHSNQPESPNGLPPPSTKAQDGDLKGPVIIGETMTRVEAAAAKFPGAVTLNDMPDFRALGMTDYEVTSAMMGYNRKWILEQIRSGREIIDIGLDPNRAIPSIFYQMEQNMFKSYIKRHPEFPNLTRK